MLAVVKLLSIILRTILFVRPGAMSPMLHPAKIHPPGKSCHCKYIGKQHPKLHRAAIAGLVIQNLSAG